MDGRLSMGREGGVQRKLSAGSRVPGTSVRATRSATGNGQYYERWDNDDDVVDDDNVGGETRRRQRVAASDERRKTLRKSKGRKTIEFLKTQFTKDYDSCFVLDADKYAPETPAMFLPELSEERLEQIRPVVEKLVTREGFDAALEHDRGNKGHGKAYTSVTDCERFDDSGLGIEKLTYAMLFAKRLVPVREKFGAIRAYFGGDPVDWQFQQRLKLAEELAELELSWMVILFGLFRVVVYPATSNLVYAFNTKGTRRRESIPVPSNDGHYKRGSPGLFFGVSIRFDDTPKKTSRNARQRSIAESSSGAPCSLI